MADVLSRDSPINYYSRGLRERFRLDALKLQEPVGEKGQVYADIGYEIDENKYHARSQARLRAGGLPTTVPIGWPETLEGPLVWTGTDFEDEKRYILRLDDNDKAELKEALECFKGSAFPYAIQKILSPVQSKSLMATKSAKRISRSSVLVKGLIKHQQRSMRAKVL